MFAHGLAMREKFGEPDTIAGRMETLLELDFFSGLLNLTLERRITTLLDCSYMEFISISQNHKI